MTSFVQKGFLQSRYSLVQFNRFRSKINIQRPKKPHYNRALVNAVTTPIYPKPPKTLNCFDNSYAALQRTEDNPYDKIIAREILQRLESSSAVGIFHLNPIKAEDLFKVRVTLHKQNMQLKYYGKKIIKMAVEETKYEPILPLFDSTHCIVFSHEEKVTQLLKITKRVPQMILLGGIVQDRLLSKNEFVNYSMMPNLQIAQSQLVGTLEMAAGQIVNDLESHQKNFVNILDVYSKDEKNSSLNKEIKDENKDNKG